VAALPTTAGQRCWLRTIRISAPFSPSSLPLPMWSKVWPRPRAAQGRPSDALVVRCSPPVRWTLARCAPLPHSALLLLPNPLRGGRSDGGGHCGAGCSGHEGVPSGFVVGGVHLVDGGDGAVASGEHTLASLHFASSKEMLRCVENACCKRMFQVFWMFQRYVAMF
jgi:hypothetical protein